MKLRVTSWPYLGHTNHNRNFTHHALLNRCYFCFQLTYSHYPRRKLRMAPTKHPCKRGISILYPNLPTYCSRPILWFLPLQKNMICRHPALTYNNSNSVHRLRSSLRTNIILSRYSHYKHNIHHPLHWTHPSRMNLRRLLSRQPNTYPTFYNTLHHAIFNLTIYNHSYNSSTRNRLQQPHRT